MLDCFELFTFYASGITDLLYPCEYDSFSCYFRHGSGYLLYRMFCLNTRRYSVKPQSIARPRFLG